MKKEKFNINFKGQTYVFDNFGNDMENLLQLVSKENSDKPTSELDEIDIELFFEKYFISEVTADFLQKLIMKEYERRVKPFYDIRDREARSFAIEIFTDRFMLSEPTLYKAGSLYGTACDYLDDNYQFVNFYNEGTDEEFSFIADFSEATFDYATFLDTFDAPQSMVDKAVTACISELREKQR